MWIGSATSIRGTATQKNSTGLAVVAARNRNGSRGVNATSTIGKASSAGVSAVPSAEIADSSGPGAEDPAGLDLPVGALLEVLTGRRQTPPHPRAATRARLSPW